MRPDSAPPRPSSSAAPAPTPPPPATSAATEQHPPAPGNSFPPTRRPATLASGRTRPADDSPPDSSSAEGTGEEVREDSGGAGNETDVEDEDGMGEESPSTGEERPIPPRDSSDLLPPGSAAMYPFPSTESQANHLHYDLMHYRRRNMHVAPPSSAEVLLSSATSDSSASSSPDDNAGARPGPSRPAKRRRHRSADPSRPHLQQPPLQHPQVPRLRRIGALGISVHSDSDPDEPNISGLDSADRRPERNTGESMSDNTRATDLGINSDQLRKSHGAASPAAAGGVLRPQRPRRRGTVPDATFRGVVDELAVQNRELRERLRRYEVDGVPTEVKQDRLFEIRFFEGLPAAKRVELENYLTRYVQTYAESAADGPDSAAPLTARFENRILAGPSNSGLEPPSLSGTGSGIRLPPVARPVHPVTDRHHDSGAGITDPRAVAVAREIVASLEALFQTSLMRTVRTQAVAPPAVPLPPLDPSRPVPNTSSLADSNEKYFANLLSYDFLSQGFVYLNLVLTMAQIYRFNVTVAFVQRAVRQFSHNLELSEDGGRIRWKGPRTPVDADDAALNSDVGDLVRFAKAAAPRRAGEVDSVGGASSAPSRSTRASGSRDPSSKETVVSDSRGSSGDSSSRDPSSGAGTLLANSLAPSSRTNQTSLPSAGRKTSSAARPVRPTAAVLQPMDRLQTSMSPDQMDMMAVDPPAIKAAGAIEGARSKHVDAPGAGDATDAAAAGQHDSNHKTSSAQDGSDALSAANLDAHNLGIELAASARTHASSQAVASTTTSGQNAVGALVFYGNGIFCSDLSKEGEGPVTPPVLPPKDERLARPLGAQDDDDGSDASSPGADDMALDDGDDQPIDLDAAVLEVIGDEVRAARSSSEGDGTGSGSGSGSGSRDGSAASSLKRLRMSGMTPAFPADFFTVVVKTRHPPKRTATDALPTPDTPGQGLAREREPSFSSIVPASKRPRLAGPRVSAEVLSTREIYHNPRVQMRRPVDAAGGTESRSSSSADRDEDPLQSAWSYGHLLTSSNLAKHAGGGTGHRPTADDLVPTYLPPTPSPPSPPPDHQADYLLSLAAPSHSWSPEESGFHTSGSGGLAATPPSGTDTAAKAAAALPSKGGPVHRAKNGNGRGGGSSGSTTTPSSSADERPISLDDVVDVPTRLRLP